MFATKQRNSLTMKKATTIVIMVINIFHAAGDHNKHQKLFYILSWTPMDYLSYQMLMGQEAFENCSSDNCFFTDDTAYFANITTFDAIMFNVVELKMGMNKPDYRIPQQIYCMYGFEPAAPDHRVPQEFDYFFNITFTYKLTSTITIPFIQIKDDDDKVIGPDINVEWTDWSLVKEVTSHIKKKLQDKSIAAAWIHSNCEPLWPDAAVYAKHLKIALNSYGHRLDIYKKCGPTRCPEIESRMKGMCGQSMCPEFERMDECLALVESDYYFYLSFEKLFAEDYVTEKLLRALQHFAVPVVFGNTNYSRYVRGSCSAHLELILSYVCRLQHHTYPVHR